MRISFDLDEVLFVSPDECGTEPPRHFPVNRLFPEHLRRGTVSLIRELKEQGDEVWLCTASFRADIYIRTLFRHYGLHLDGIINTGRHISRGKNRRGEPIHEIPSPAGISLHAGDEKDVPPEARTSVFQAVKVSGSDDNWTQKILEEAGRIRRLAENP